MTPTQTAVWQLAMVIAQQLANGNSINPGDQIAQRLIAAAVASANTDQAGATLENAASAAASTLAGGLGA